MVEYEYEDLFYQHTTTHILIVPSGTTVEGVENEPPTVGEADFVINSDTDIKLEAFELRENLCSADNLKFGLQESAYCKFTVFNKPTIPNLKNKEIAIYLYFDSNSITLFRVGTYIVKEDEYSADRITRDISAYDLLHYLKNYDITKWYNKVYKNTDYISIQDLRTSLFTWLSNNFDIDDCTIVMKEDETTDGQYNDDYLVGKTIESDVVTFDFFMQGILELRGCFGHMNRLGEFECKWMVWYDVPAVRILNEFKIIPPTKYEDENTWFIGFVDVYDEDNKQLFHVGSSSKKYPSIYTIADSFVLQESSRPNWKEDTEAALQVMRDAITHLYYKPCEVLCRGNLCLEVGDRVRFTWFDPSDERYLTFSTYILERRFTGINGFKDTYYAKGDRKQPKYKVTNDNWHTGDGEGSSGEGSDGVSEVDDEFKKKFIKCIRNIGFHLLDEPSNCSVVYNETDLQVEVKWSDPNDIETEEPVSAEWAGTVVVRREDDIPWFKWDNADVIIDSTTRDEYSSTALIDDTIELDKKYYYGIFPYDTNGNYRFTKVYSVNTYKPVIAPELRALTLNTPTQMQVSYFVPEGYTWDYIKLVYKTGGIPTSITDGTAVDLDEEVIVVTVKHLLAESHYFFIIYAKEHTTGKVVNSDSLDMWTGEKEKYAFTEKISVSKGGADRIRFTEEVTVSKVT